MDNARVSAGMVSVCLLYFICIATAGYASAERPPSLEERINTARASNGHIKQAVHKLLATTAKATAPENNLRALSRQLNAMKKNLVAPDTAALKKELQARRKQVETLRQQQSSDMQKAYIELDKRMSQIEKEIDLCANEYDVLKMRIDEVIGRVAEWVAFYDNTVDLLGAERVREQLKTQVEAEAKRWR